MSRSIKKGPFVDVHLLDKVAKAAATNDRRPIHHSPVFWIGIVMCLAAIAIYLWSDDLSWRPGTR